MCVHVGGQRSMLGVFLYSSPLVLFIFETGSFMSPKLTNSARRSSQ